MKNVFWLTIWMISIELLIVLTLIPGKWIEQVIAKEAQLIEKRFSSEKAQWIQQKATHAFDKSLIQTGAYKATHHFLIPTTQQKQNSIGLDQAGDKWFLWVDSRLRSLALSYYHVLLRFTFLLAWLPYLAILFIPACIDGLVTKSIKRTNFDYTSPLLHRYSMKGILMLCGLIVTLFLLPFALEPMIIPILLMLACIMTGIMLGNLQKRL